MVHAAPLRKGKNGDKLACSCVEGRDRQIYPHPVLIPLSMVQTMSKKVIGLVASPRRKESNTLRLVEAVLEGARKEGAATDLIDVYSLHIGYCTACGTCYATGECTLSDDFPELFDKLMGADGIVLGAPNYVDSVPAPMKAVFDRMSDAIHCRMFTGKFGCSVCTAGGGNQDEIVAYMNHVLNALGAIAIGGVGVAVSGGPTALMSAVEEARGMGKTLVEAIRGEHTYPDQEEILRQRRDHFRQMVILNKEKWPHEYDWYVRMGWISE